MKIATYALTLLCLGLLACGAEDEEGAALEDIPACDSRGEGPGVWGRVAVPSCATGVPSATVTVFDQLQFEITTVTTDEKGEFQIAASSLKGDGVYILTARSGPYRGPASPMPFTLSGGRSPYQVIKLNGSP